MAGGVAGGSGSDGGNAVVGSEVTSGILARVHYVGPMVIRLGVAVVLGVLAAVVAFVANRSANAASGSGPVAVRAEAPVQLFRPDFARPDAPWLVVLFSSASCEGCAKMAAKVEVLESAAVATTEVEYGTDRELHRRYAVEAVPLVVIADSEGVTRKHFFGSTSATDLWAALAELRAESA